PFATLAALLLRNARHLAEARETGQARSAFLHLAAHELRTPLAVIRGYLSLLQDGTYPVAERTRGEAVGAVVVQGPGLGGVGGGVGGGGGGGGPGGGGAAGRAGGAGGGGGRGSGGGRRGCGRGPAWRARP